MTGNHPYIFRDHVSAKRNHVGVTDDAIVEDGNVRGAATDINHRPLLRHYTAAADARGSRIISIM
jgi:hypothetical protein